MSAQNLEIYQLIAELAKKARDHHYPSEMPELLDYRSYPRVMSNGLVSGIVDTKQQRKTKFASCFLHL